MSQSINSTNGRQVTDTSEHAGVSSVEDQQTADESSALESCRRQAARFIQERPLTSVMTLFGAGLGAGVAVGCLIARSASAGRGSIADEIGRSIVKTISDAVPNSLSGKS